MPSWGEISAPTHVQAEYCKSPACIFGASIRCLVACQTPKNESTTLQSLARTRCHFTSLSKEGAGSIVTLHGSARRAQPAMHGPICLVNTRFTAIFSQDEVFHYQPQPQLTALYLKCLATKDVTAILVGIPKTEIISTRDFSFVGTALCQGFVVTQ